MTSGGPPPAFSARRTQLARVADSLDARLPEIAREMRDLLADSIRDLNADPQMVELLQASIEGNVTTICHMLANDIPPEHLQPTTAAVEYAVRLAQRDVPISSLTRAYYLGQSMFIRLSLDVVEELDATPDERMELIRDVADVVHRYIDWILQYVSVVHEQERRRWWSARATLNAATIRKVLQGDLRAAAPLEHETGYRLDRTHLAVVAWTEGTGSDADQQRIERMLRRIATAIGSPHPPLTSAVDPATAWAWIASPGPREAGGLSPELERLVALEPGVRLAWGDRLPGADGFRVSHEQAIAAHLVALSSVVHRPRTVVGYGEPGTALLALLVRDAAARRRFVHDVLGDLVSPDPAARQTRETLGAFFAAGENYMRAAEALGTHRNTVHRRVQKFLDSRERVVDPLEAALALRLYDAFEDLGDDRKAQPPTSG